MGELPGLSSRLDAVRPDLAELHAEMVEQLWRSTGIDPVLLELCRLRIAMLHGDRAAITSRTLIAVEAGLDEATVDALAQWPNDPRFGAAARAALGLAESFVMDVHAIADADVAAAVAALGERRTVGLMLAFGVFDGATRMNQALETTQRA